MHYVVSRARTPNVIISEANYPHAGESLLAMLWSLASDTASGYPSPYLVTFL